ncbi:MAG: response regulator [Rhodospirillales bacterium]|jgi:two-component system OmpR family response regulator
MRRLERILYVEDDHDVRDIGGIVLEMEGFDVRACASGAEAVALARTGTFAADLVLLDVMMPGLDGPATLAQLRTIPAVTTLPVVFLTAKAYPREVEALRALGAVGVLPKPFDPATLGEALRRIYATTGGGGG